MTEVEIFSRRLRSARVMKQLTMDDLREHLENLCGINISKPAISKYENAKMLPSPEVRKALAKVLGVDSDYFSRPLTCTAETFTVNFRKKSSMRASEVNALREKVNDKVERYLEIEEILRKAEAEGSTQKPLNSGIISTPADAKAFAIQLRNAWGLKDFPIVNVQRELEAHGIKVIPIAESEDFDGLSGKINDENIFVVINTSKRHIERRRLTVMHEVGHQLMNFSPTLTPHDQEKLCNVFANEMLVTTNAFTAALKGEHKIDLVALRPLQLYYGISIDAMMKKAEETELITTSYYTSFNIHKSKSRNYSDAVEQSLYSESPIYDRYLTLVLKAYSMHLIDKAKAESMLYDINPELKNDLFAI